MATIFKVSTHLVKEGKLNEMTSKSFINLQEAYDYADVLLEENFKDGRKIIRYGDGESSHQHINRDLNEWVVVRVKPEGDIDVDKLVELTLSEQNQVLKRYGVIEVDVTHKLANVRRTIIVYKERVFFISMKDGEVTQVLLKP